MRGDAEPDIARLLGPIRRHFYDISERKRDRPHVLVVSPKRFRLLPKLVVKLPDPTRVGSDAPTDLRVEAALLTACERQALPAPALLRAGCDEGILMMHINGVTLNEFLDTPIESLARRRNDVMHQLARLLAKVHDRLSTDPGLKNSELPVRDSLNELSLLEVRIASLDIEYRRVSEPMLMLLRKSTPRHEVRAVTHGDCSVSNVLVTKDGDLALIDWECAAWAPVELELSFVVSWANGLCRNPEEIQYFLDTYQQHSQRKLISFNFYCAVDMLKQATAAQSVGRNFRPFIDVAKSHLELLLR